MGRVGPEAGEVAGKDQGDRLFDSFVRRLWILRTVFKHILISNVIISPKIFLMLNILGKCYTSWLLLIVVEEVECTTVRGSLLLLAISTSVDFFFFQWASLSLAEALKISKGGSALKYLISSRGSWAEGWGVPQEGLLCGSMYTNNEIFFNASCGLEFSPLVRHQRGKTQHSSLTFDLNLLKS